MAETTTISWCDATFNPWLGCSRVSLGCLECYAARDAHRWEKKRGKTWGAGSGRYVYGAEHWKAPLRWNKNAALDDVRKKVFCASTADVFEEFPGLDDHRVRIWDLIAQTPNLDWQLLTKRPQNILKMVPATWLTGNWPYNVWIGTSVEDQAAANKRIPEILRVPAAVRFLSCEPLLGPVELKGVKEGDLQWVIVGGESGPGARPMDLAWARSLKDQCQDGGIALWVKQLGGVRNKRQELSDLPEDLRIRAFPCVHNSWADLRQIRGCQ
jgi:protein gp37